MIWRRNELLDVRVLLFQLVGLVQSCEPWRPPEQISLGQRPVCVNRLRGPLRESICLQCVPSFHNLHLFFLQRLTRDLISFRITAVWRLCLDAFIRCRATQNSFTSAFRRDSSHILKPLLLNLRVIKQSDWKCHESTPPHITLNRG